MSTWTKCRTIVLQKPKINDWSWSAGHTSYFYVQVPDKCPAKPSVIHTSWNDWSQKMYWTLPYLHRFYVGYNHWEMGQGLQDICPALSRALFWASSHQEVKSNPLTHPSQWAFPWRAHAQHTNIIMQSSLPKSQWDFESTLIDIKRLLLVQVPSQTDTGIKSSLYYLAYIFLLLRQNNS